MNRLRTCPTLFLTALAALAAGCSDPAPSAVVPVQGAPIANVAVDEAPAASSGSTGLAPAPAVPPAEPAIGDLSAPGDRSPEDEAVTTTPAAREPAATKDAATQPAVPPSAAPAPAPETVPAPPPAKLEPVASTPAMESAKPPLPDKPPAPPPARDAAAKDAAAKDAAAKDAPAKPEAAKSFVPKDKKKADAIELTWDELASFEFVAPPPVYSDPETGKFPDQTEAIEKATRQIPAEIWELEGQTITVEGYMIPLEYAEEGVRSFLISRHAMGCCFGVMPKPHELVECDMGEQKPPPYVGYLPVKVTGALHIGLKHGPATVLSGIYRMDAPKVTVEKDR